MNKKLMFVVFIIIVISVIMFNVNMDNLFIIDNNGVQENNNDNENSNSKDEENNMDEFVSKINININGTNYIATLEDNETTREFVKRLPMEVNMNELNGNEKYYYFNDSLPSNSSKVGKINDGDLMLYGSDCLVLFYESFNSSYSYTKIGKIADTSSLKDNVGKGSIKILFTK